MAAELAIQKLRESNKHATSYETKPVKPPYLSHTIKSLSDDAKKVLDKAYEIRANSFSDKKWVDLYADWLKATDNQFHSEDGLKQLKTFAFFYKRHTKDSKDGLADIYRHEFKRRTDIEYDA